MDPRRIVESFSTAAVHAGGPGGVAMSAQVLSFMWLHTVCNHQWVHGGSLWGTVRKLYGQGGILRLYSGVVPTLFLTSTVRFGDVAANAGCMAAFAEWERETGQSFSLHTKTLAASVLAAGWRFALTPLEVIKTNLMVSGKDGWRNIQRKVRQGGVGVSYYGSLAGLAIGCTAHFPWFYTHNVLQESMPQVEHPLATHLRHGAIGFSASAVAACTSNWIRVLKANKQACVGVSTYMEGARHVIQRDGLLGLATRGLSTRILTQGLQGSMFAVVWKTLEAYAASVRAEREARPGERLGPIRAMAVPGAVVETLSTREETQGTLSGGGLPVVVQEAEVR